MPKSSVVKTSELSAWSAERLRLTAFHQQGAQKVDNGWWETITGSSPESKNMKPREGAYEVSGTYSGGVLTLKADPLRFDWSYSAAIPLDKPLADFPSVGALPDAIGVFVPLMANWLGMALGDINRIAFGAITVQPVSDRVAGYKLLDAYLPSVEVDPDNSSDFHYQINRHHIAEAFDKIHVNRLSKWSVARMQPLMLTMVIGQELPSANTLAGEALSALRLEVDINTDSARREPIPGNQLPNLFKHLTELGLKIAENGDIK